MGSSREESPDWLRSFQAPTTQSAVTLSSDSESAHSDDATEKGYEGGVTLNKEEKYREKTKLDGPSCSIWTLSSDSDSESCLAHDPKEADVTKHDQEALKKSLTDGEKGKDALNLDIGKKTASTKSRKLKPQKEQLEMDDVISKEEKSIKGDDHNMKTTDDDIAEKRTEPLACSSRLPLILSEKVQRTKALVECEGESIEMSGDMGAVGRVVVSETPSGNHDMFLDLKGTVYKTTILPSRTFCIVSLNQSEAKIEAIMNDFIQLKPQSNVFEAETMVEGTLDGFSFDDDDEGEKMPKAATHQADDDEGTEGKNSRKRKGKALEQTLGSAPKKLKTGGKPQKKVRKKPQAPKRNKNKK